jgi:hypothetical protein
VSVLLALVLVLNRVRSMGAPIAPSLRDSGDPSTNSCRTPSGAGWLMPS